LGHKLCLKYVLPSRASEPRGAVCPPVVTGSGHDARRRAKKTVDGIPSPCRFVPKVSLGNGCVPRTMLRLLLLETKSAFAERLAAALSIDGQAGCERIGLKAFDRRARASEEPPFDAILLEWRRDESDRARICRQVSRAGVRRPVIAVTFIEDIDEAMRALEAGAEDVCLRGEIEDEVLLQRIRLATERYHWQARQAVSSVTVNWSDFSRTSASPDSWWSPEEEEEEEGADAAPGTPETFRILVASASLGSPVPDRMRVGSANVPVEVTRVGTWEEACADGPTEAFDGVILDLDDAGTAALAAVRACRANWPSAAIVVTLPDADTESAVAAIREGADDCLDRVAAGSGTVPRYLQLAVTRRERRAAELVEPIDVPIEDARIRQYSVAPSEQRQHPRYFVTRSAIAFPVGRDFSPSQAVCAEGSTCDVSETGVRLELTGLECLSNRLLVVGVEASDGTLEFATVEVCNWTNGPGVLQIGGRFATADRDLLRAENLTPTFQPDTRRFETGLPVDILHRWVELGVLRPVLFDRIYVCPKCESMPSFRSGCRCCGSIHVASQRLVHHFDCAFLGPAREFEKDGRVRCPKCRVEGLKAGVDFEYVNGPYHCLDCGVADTETEVVGQCLTCQWRFPFKQAAEEELIGYHVDRLDPYALMGT